MDSNWEMGTFFIKAQTHLFLFFSDQFSSHITRWHNVWDLRSYRFNTACVKNDYDHFSAGFCCSVLLAWLHLLKKVKCFDLGGFCLEFIVLCSIFVQHRTVKAVISSPSVDNYSPFKKRCFHLQFLHIAPLMCINITEILTYWSI